MNEILKGTETKPIALYKHFIALCNLFFLLTVYIKEKKGGRDVYKKHKKKTLLGSSDLTTW